MDPLKPDTQPAGTSHHAAPYGRAQSPNFAYEPPPSASGSSGAEPSLSLQQVHYIVRHGERTPVRARLDKADPPIPRRWNVCHEANRFRAALFPAVHGQQHEELPLPPSNRAVELLDDDGRPLPLAEGDCLYGELTDLGRHSTFAVGQRLRTLYGKQLGFLPDLDSLSAKDNSAFYFRSTNMPRTVESLQQLVTGLFTPSEESTSSSSTISAGSSSLAAAAARGFVPQLRVREMTSEDLLPNTVGCATFRKLDAFFSVYAASLWNEHLARHDALVAPHNEGRPVRVDSHPRLNGVLDTVHASRAHGIAVPAVFADDKSPLLRDMERAVVTEWFAGYTAPDAAKREQFRRLAMGRFLNSLSDKLEAKADAAPGAAGGRRRGAGTDSDAALKLGLYAAHDTSVAGILATLGAFQDRWPSFTASLGVELFRDDRPQVQLGFFSRTAASVGLGKPVRPPHYVRLRFGDSTLQLPGCAAAGSHLSAADSGDGRAHPEFCTLDAFLAMTRALKHPQGMSWAQECNMHADSQSKL